MMTTNSCAAHAVYRESQTTREDIRPSRAAGDAVLEFDRFLLLLRRRQLIADGVPIEVGSRALDLLLTLIEDDGSSEVTCPMDFATTAGAACLEVAPCTR